MTKKIDHVYQIWCEYDIGQQSIVFIDKEDAMAYAHARLTEQGFEDVYFLEAANLLDVIILEVI